MRTKQNSLITVVIVTMLLSACSAFPLTRLGESARLPSAGQPAASQPQSAAPAALPQSSASSSSSLESFAAQQGTLEEIYTRVNPSVVNVQVTVKASVDSSQLPDPNSQNPFGFSNPQSGNPVQQGLGSGFILDTEGHIVTNNHVVDGADQVTVTFSDGSSYPATVVGKDPNSDLAVIKVDAPANLLIPVTLADATQLKVGQMAIAIGNPFGLEGTMTVGIISALGRSLPVDLQTTTSSPSYTIPDVIQTDAPINPGNSGGVLLNDLGQVIGVTSAIESSSGANAGIGFAIPVNLVQRVVPELIKNGSYQHTWMGISGVTLSSAMAKEMGLKEDQRGILVGAVTPGSPAEKAGLKGSQKQVQIDGIDTMVGGDIIIAVDGQPVKRFDDLVSYLFSNGVVGQNLKLDILRDGKPMTLDLVLAARPANTEQASSQSSQSVPQKTSGQAWLGIRGMDMNKDVASEMSLEQNQQGVLVVDVQPGSPAEAAGLKGSDKAVTIGNQTLMVGGDVITAFNNTAINNMKELKTAISNTAPGEKVELKVLRNGQSTNVEITLTEAPVN